MGSPAHSSPVSGTAPPEGGVAAVRGTGSGAPAPADVPRELSRASAVFLGAVAAAAVLGTVLLALGAERGHGNWITFGVLAAGAAFAQLFAVRTTHDQVYHTTIVFIVAAALLLPPELIAAVCIVQHLPEWIKERYPWYIQGFNIANYVAGAVAASAAAGVVLRSETVTASPRGLTAGVVAAVVFVTLNHALLAVMLRLARGHRIRETGLFSVPAVATDFVLAALGMGFAAWWEYNPWFLPLAIAPLALVQRSLSVPRLEAEARLDAKTGLYNARHLEIVLREELERAKRFKRPLALILADLDLLRDVNNTHGHLAGDVVLRGVADVFREELRAYDIAARFGGEEFAIVLPETSLERAGEIADQIRRAVSETRFEAPGSGKPIRATLSIGVAAFPETASTADTLLHEADIALYTSKSNGRNLVSLADPSRNETQAPIAFPSRKSVAARVTAAPEEAKQSASANAAPAPVPLPAPATAPAPAADEAPRAAERPSGERKAMLLVGVLAVITAGLMALLAPGIFGTVSSDPWIVLTFALLTIALQVLSVDLYGSGGEAASAVGMLATGILLGPGPAMVIAFTAGLVQLIRTKGIIHRGIFDASNFALSAGLASLIYSLAVTDGTPVAVKLVLATGAGLVHKVINTGLLCVAMSLSESVPVGRVWNERFRWARFHYVAFGPLAFAAALAFERMGVVGVIAFSVPPVLLTLSVRQYIERTRASVEEVRRANQQLMRANLELAESTERVRKTHLATIAALSRSMEAKDYYTGGHTERVSAVAVAIAARLGYSGAGLEAIEIGALLHDIGKIGIPEAILHKPGPLDEAEWKVMKEHPVISDYILADVEMNPIVRQIVRSSHERMDGKGYPDGLRGDEIPMPARIILVADAYDALTSDRPYRPGRSISAALAELRRHMGTQFCPTVVEVLERVCQEDPSVLGLADPPAEAAA